jgi:hypothetical protein
LVEVPKTKNAFGIKKPRGEDCFSADRHQQQRRQKVREKTVILQNQGQTDDLPKEETWMVKFQKMKSLSPENTNLLSAKSKF